LIRGLGIDVCPVERIQGILDRHGTIFTERVFTPAELEHAGDGVVRAERLAARWAAKEAAIKALGAPAGMAWHDLEVTNDADGAPALVLHGAAATRAAELGNARTLISLSHAGGVAVAVVILEGADR
jgi:holo-[acyl-carrier protein] synthase